jgi:acetone carboxylase gamma subunit
MTSLNKDDNEILYARDDIYFCPDCRQFHDVETGKTVDVPGMDYYFDPDTGKRYKVKKSKNKTQKVKRGFGNPSNN